MLNLNLLVYLFDFSILISAQFQTKANHAVTVSKSNLYHINPIAGDQMKETRISDLKSPFSFQSQQIKIMIHGWTADRNHISVIPIRDGYLATGHDAIFIADWSEVARTFYFYSRNLVRPVGIRLAKLIENFIRKNNIDPSRIHILGHSLGAHVAGNIGDYFNGTIGRITGLDPAGPLFESFVNDGLLPKHAKFVDCIHTDWPIFGDSLQRGHVDFYPNYGKIGQPGCGVLELLSLSDCSHVKSTFFYAESIQLPETFVSFPCSLKDILKEHCYSKKAKSYEYMGEMVSTNARGTHFLRTNRASPYGMGLYSVVHLKLIRNNNSIDKSTDSSSISNSLAEELRKNNEKLLESQAELDNTEPILPGESAES